MPQAMAAGAQLREGGAWAGWVWGRRIAGSNMDWVSGGQGTPQWGLSGSACLHICLGQALHHPRVGVERQPHARGEGHRVRRAYQPHTLPCAQPDHRLERLQQLLRPRRPNVVRALRFLRLLGQQELAEFGHPHLISCGEAVLVEMAGA